MPDYRVIISYLDCLIGLRPRRYRQEAFNLDASLLALLQIFSFTLFEKFPSSKRFRVVTTNLNRETTAFDLIYSRYSRTAVKFYTHQFCNISLCFSHNAG